MERDAIYIIVPIPLVDSDNEVELYKIIGLPLPIPSSSPPPVDENGVRHPSVVAEYQLESPAFAIDIHRSKYTLLTAEEARQCSSELTGFCQIRSTFYPVNLSDKCIIALFMNIEGNDYDY